MAKKEIIDKYNYILEMENKNGRQVYDSLSFNKLKIFLTGRGEEVEQIRESFQRYQCTYQTPLKQGNFQENSFSVSPFQKSLRVEDVKKFLP